MPEPSTTSRPRVIDVAPRSGRARPAPSAARAGENIRAAAVSLRLAVKALRGTTEVHPATRDRAMSQLASCACKLGRILDELEAALDASTELERDR